MPLRDDLLAPIPGDNPSGKKLRYDRVYDQIKEARTEEDDTLPAGAWERSAKRADYRLVIKLATDVLSTKSKDLQIAAWLGEAHIKTEGAGQLTLVLQLLLELQEAFWDTIYPEIDEGDAGLRAVPLQWAANRYAALVYAFPLTKGGVDFHMYKAARALGSEADVAGNETRQKARAAAIARGQLTAEEVDTSIGITPKSFYAALEETLRESLDKLEELAAFCEEKYGDDGPSYRKLRESLEEVQNVVSAQLNEKRRLEPDAVPAEEALVEPAPVAVAEPVAATPAAVVAAPPPPAAVPVAAAVAAPVAVPPAAVAGTGGMPQSWDAALSTVVACARYMANERRGSAVPYLLQTDVRWGELRKEWPKPPLSLLEAPAPEDRTFLKLAASEQRWSDVLQRAVSLAGGPAGRAWLDLHRYIWMAASESGFRAFKDMVVRSVHGLLIDFPELPKWTLADDTPTANAETQQWISAEVLAGNKADASGDAAAVWTHAEATPVSVLVPAAQPATPAFVAVPLPALGSPEANGSGGHDREEDVFTRAAAMASAGQLREATRLLARDAAMQPTGRLRYRRRLEMAQLCVAGNSGAIALPVLRELIAEVDERKLETWEEGDMVTRPLALMLQCMTRPEEASERDRIFSKLCRIDPTAALEILP